MSNRKTKRILSELKELEKSNELFSNNGVHYHYNEENIYQDDINAVINILKSDFLTQGPTIPLFEQAISNYCNVISIFRISIF